MRGKKSKEVYNYTSIQSIQYTLYSIQCTWVQYTVCKGYSIQYTGYKGIRVYSIQGTKGSGKRVYNVEDLARWAQALRIFFTTLRSDKIHLFLNKHARLVDKESASQIRYQKMF